MSRKLVQFKVAKVVKAPTKVRFQTKDGKFVSFRAKKEELMKDLPNKQVGVSMTNDIWNLGGDVVPDPRGWNPYHAVTNGLIVICLGQRALCMTVGILMNKLNNIPEEYHY
jgi:hypothetical protein